MNGSLPAIKKLMESIPKRLVDQNGHLYELVVEFNIEIIGEDMVNVFYRGVSEEDNMDKVIFPIKEENEDVINGKIMEIEDNIKRKGMLVMKRPKPKTEYIAIEERGDNYNE